MASQPDGKKNPISGGKWEVLGASQFMTLTCDGWAGQIYKWKGNPSYVIAPASERYGGNVTIRIIELINFCYLPQEASKKDNLTGLIKSTSNSEHIMKTRRTPWHKETFYLLQLEDRLCQKSAQNLIVSKARLQKRLNSQGQ